MPTETTIVINVKCNGKLIKVDSLGPNDTIGDLKRVLFDKTQIIQETQKIMGLKTIDSIPISDTVKLINVVLKPNTKLMLIGSTQEAVRDITEVQQASAPAIVDDFDFEEEYTEIAELPENVDKVKRRSAAYKTRKLCEPRPGKGLLVLDVDYTIFDHLSPAESVRQLARPYLHEFLARAYIHYDIAIWSATSMTWVLAKLTQLGVIPANAGGTIRSQMTNTEEPVNSSDLSILATAARPSDANYQVCLLLDSSDMISVYFPTHGVKEVKPLAVIWNNHPQWGPQNTIMFDDVRRNFIMNRQSGLRIRAYREAHVNCKTDTELRGLARYLEIIATHESDFSDLHHSRWERYIEKHKQSDTMNRKRSFPTSLSVPVGSSATSISSMLGPNPDSVGKTKEEEEEAEETVAQCLDTEKNTKIVPPRADSP